MEKIDVLKQKKDQVLDFCLEKDASLYATKQKIIQYNQALKIKDHYTRIKKSCFSMVGGIFSFLIPVFLLYKSPLGASIFSSIEIYYDCNVTIVLLMISFTTIQTTLSYIEDYKEYKKVNKRYDHLSIEELKQKINLLELSQKDLEDKLQESRVILNYLKEEITKEEKKIIRKQKEFTKKVEVNDFHIEYQDIHLDEYEVPKVKIKRRD